MIMGVSEEKCSTVAAQFCQRFIFLQNPNRPAFWKLSGLFPSNLFSDKCQEGLAEMEDGG
jgi:hypothetical protein